MKKLTMVLLALLVMSIASIGFVFAYGPFGTNAGTNLQREQNGTHYADMQKIMTTGSFADLVTYRQTSGVNVMPWVGNTDDFVLAQKMHSQINSWSQTNKRASGQGRRGGCPMMNDGDE